MAICLGRICRNGASLSCSSLRKCNPYLDLRITNTTAVSPALSEVTNYENLPLYALPVPSSVAKAVKPLKASSDDIIIWSRGISRQELGKVCVEFNRERAVALINLEKALVLFAEDCKAYKEQDSNKPCSEGKPSQDQLQQVHNVLAEDLPRFFEKTMRYNIYNRNVIFENNISGSRTMGIFAYAKHVAFYKIVAHIKFAYVRVAILKITLHPEDGTVKVRWRIVGISGLKAMLMFWKFNIFNQQKNQEKSELWYDGFSTFYVGSDGLIYKHIADKMMPDGNDLRTAIKGPLAAKMALMLGLAPHDLYMCLDAGSKLDKLDNDPLLLLSFDKLE